MKKCGKCGAENRNENNFCQNCGYEFKGSAFGKSNKNLIERFNNANILVKIITILIVFCIIIFILGYMNYIFFGTHYTEDEPTERIEAFNELDTDNDGAISLYEIEDIIDDIPYDKLSIFFDGCDKNDNGVLKGGEFDNMVIHINGHYNKMKTLKKIEDEKAEKEQSSSTSSESISSSSSTKSSTGYVDGCPECGYDEIIRYPDPYGHIVYECSVCGYMSYDFDDFIIEERFAKSIFPTIKNKLSLIQDFGVHYGR